MAYNIEKDERVVTYDEERKQFLVNIDQVQVADPSNFISMVTAWETQLQNATKFMETEEASLESAKGQVEIQHKDTVARVKKEIENLKVSIQSFTPALLKLKKVHPEVHEEAVKLIEEAKSKKNK